MWYSGDQDFEHGTQVAPATSQLHFLVQAYIILFSSPIQLNIGLLEMGQKYMTKIRVILGSVDSGC